jgi:FxsC-like protein
VSGPHVGGADNAAPYFFLSYAHTPRYDLVDPTDPDAWVVDLYSDLCKHIMHLTDLPLGAKPGFMDRELRPGNDWPEALSRALATCRVFVPLYSRRYFESEQCGKEWFAFSRRVLNQAAKGTLRPRAIVPAIWVPVEPHTLPEAAKSIHFDHRELGDRYITHGFYGIIKLARYRDAYEEAVYELARRIVNVARDAQVAPGQPDDYESLDSAFGSAHPRSSTSRRLRVTIAAPTADNLPEGRDPDHYGRSPRDWNPYKPDSARPLADHACDLVRNLDYRPVVGDLDGRGDALASDSPPTDPEVLLVDPWAVMQTESSKTLHRLDQLDKPWIQVVVPWNRSDAQTAAAEVQLRTSLGESLSRKLAEVRATSSMAMRGVPCLEDFSLVLPLVVRTAVRQYLRRADAYPPAGPVVKKPRLRGPATDQQNPERADD